MQKCFDLVICAHRRHVNQLVLGIPFIFDNLRPDNVVVISSAEVNATLKQIFGGAVSCVDERAVAGVDLPRFYACIRTVGVPDSRANWYLQQFLKMAYCFSTDKKFYVAWDADTIPLESIPFVDESGRYLFNKKAERHAPYFETMANILGVEAESTGISLAMARKNSIFRLLSAAVRQFTRPSFISEYMPFDTSIMKELIAVIERHGVPGDFWYETVLKKMCKKGSSCFSEFETYGNFMMRFHSHRFRNVRLKTLRNGMKKFGRVPRRRELLKLGGLGVSTISFENWEAMSDQKLDVLDIGIRDDVAEWLRRKNRSW